MFNAYQTSNGFAPKEQPKVLPIALGFSASVSEISVDLFIENTTGIISFIQSMYIDNKDNFAPLVVTFPITGQEITCPQNAQGVFSIYAINHFQAVFSCAGGDAAKVHLCNFQQPTMTWQFNSIINRAIRQRNGDLIRDRAGNVIYQRVG